MSQEFVPRPSNLIRYIAWLMLLLVSISTPAVQSLFFFSLTSSNPGSIAIQDANFTTTGVVHFGAYGYCIPFISDGDTLVHCSNRRLGHTFDTTVQDALGISGIQDVYPASTSKAMVLNPLACALMFLGIAVDDISIFEPLLTTAAFLFDIITVAHMRDQVQTITGDAVDVSRGPCVWLAMVAFILIWICYIIYFFYSLYQSTIYLESLHKSFPVNLKTNDAKADIELV